MVDASCETKIYFLKVSIHILGGSCFNNKKMPGGGDTVTIIYPQGCKEVTEDLTSDELIRRLKVIMLQFCD